MKSKKTRERILDASIELFNIKKASNVSTVQISAAMKISPGNLYYYYANKEEVIRCIWEERMSDKLDALMKSTEEIKTATDLLNFIEDCLNYMIDYRFFYTELPTLFANDDKLVEIYSNVTNNMRDTFTALAIRLREEGKFSDDDDVTLVMAIQNAVASVVHMLNRYELYTDKGITGKEFIGYSWIRIAALLEPVFSPSMREEMIEELKTRGYEKEHYLKLIK